MEDKQLTESQLQALLRLKRHEQPPPGYFDDLLTAIHRRQREELLRRPAWRIFAGRLRAFMASFDWRYAASMAGVLLLGIGAIQLALPRRDRPPAFVQHPAAQITPSQGTPVAIQVAVPNREPMITLQPGDPLLEIRQIWQAPPSPLQFGATGPVRFIIENQPASYETERIRF